MNKRLAAMAEEFVAHQLVRRGYQIIARNARHIGFELDIVAWRQPVMIIVEVKLRRRRIAALAEWDQLLSFKKRATLQRGALWISRECNFPVNTIRFDLALVIFDQYKDVLTMDYREHIDLSRNG